MKRSPAVTSSTRRFASLSAICFAFALAAGCPSESECDRCGDEYLSDASVDTSTMADSETTPDAEPTPEANACQARTGAACAPDQAERDCYHQVLTHQVCTTERGEALSDALTCFAEMESGSAGCGTFADPSGARACIRAAFSPYNVDVARPVAELVAERCAYPDADEALYFYPLPLAAMSESTINALSPCILGATDCAGVDACFETRFPEIFDCF